MKKHNLMPASFEKTLAQYDFPLQQNRIAQKPAHPRDSAKLLVYNRKMEPHE